MENGGVLSKQKKNIEANTSKTNHYWKTKSVRMIISEWNWESTGNSFVGFDENSLRLV
jgi:hypothetical protein